MARAVNFLIQSVLICGCSKVVITNSDSHPKIVMSAENQESTLPELPRHVYPKLIARYKRMCALDPADYSPGQTGSIRVIWNKEPYQIEVAFPETPNSVDTVLTIVKL